MNAIVSHRFSKCNLPLLVLVLVVGTFVPSNGYAFEMSDETLEEACSAAANIECDLNENSIIVSYSSINEGDFIENTCFENPTSDYLHEAWIQFSAASGYEYIFEASNANLGMNIYTGNCEVLELYACISSLGESTVWQDGLPEGEYFIQLLNLVAPEEEVESEFFFTCYIPSISNCYVTMDFVEVADCVGGAGIVNVSVGGTTNMEFLTVEILTNIGTFQIYSATVHSGNWNCDFDVQGETILYMLASAGNTSNGCTVEYADQIELPSILCADVVPGLLSFIMEDEQLCAPPSAEVSLFQAGTSTLKHTFSVSYNEGAGAYRLVNPPVGEFDAFIKPSGCLQQSYGALTISGGAYDIILEGLVKGDFDNSNAINILDVSFLSGAFGTILGMPGYNSMADFDCSGTINIADVSLFGVNYNIVGEAPPIAGE